jgi:hypothetical protein
LQKILNIINRRITRQFRTSPRKTKLWEKGEKLRKSETQFSESDIQLPGKPRKGEHKTRGGEL